MDDQMSKLLLLLGVFAGRGRRQSVLGLARHTGLPAADIRETLDALVNAGYVRAVSESEQFEISMKFLGWAAGFAADFNLERAARPVMAQLSNEIHETIYLGVLCGSDLIVLDRFLGPDGDERGFSQGDRIPGKTLAMGKLLLAFQNLEKQIPRLSSGYDYTFPADDCDLSVDYCITRQGYCSEFGELGGSRDGLAVPIWYSGPFPNVTLGVSAPISRIGSHSEYYRTQLITAADLISVNLKNVKKYDL